MRQIDTISLLVTSGNGPAECRLAVGHVLHRMQVEAAHLDITLDVDAAKAKHGPKSAVVVAHGAAVVAFACGWCGKIQWRVRSPLRPHHKRANWFVGVFLLPAGTDGQTRIAAQDVTFESFRAGGPGGQHQNTTDSAVRATHRPSGLMVVVREMRSQHRNKALALERLQGLANARDLAAVEDRKRNENRLHNALERGNPIRIFQGATFLQKGGG